MRATKRALLISAPYGAALALARAGLDLAESSGGPEMALRDALFAATLPAALLYPSAAAGPAALLAYAAASAALWAAVGLLLLRLSTRRGAARRYAAALLAGAAAAYPLWLAAAAAWEEAPTWLYLFAFGAFAAASACALAGALGLLLSRHARR